MDILQWIRDEADKLDCEALSNIESTAVIAAIIATEFDGGASVPAWLAIQSALTAAWAVQGCGGTTPEWPDDPNWVPDKKCQKVSAPGQGQYSVTKGDGSQTTDNFGTANYVKEILGWTPSTEIGKAMLVSFINRDDEQSTYTIYGVEGIFYAWVTPPANAYCVGQEPTYYPPTGPIGPSTEVEDEECKWTVTPVDSYVDNQGVYWTKYSVDPEPITCGRAFFYWNSKQGPYICNPDDFVCAPPNPRGGGGSLQAPLLTGITYYLYPPCEDPEDWGLEPGEYPELEFPIPDANAWEGIAKRIDAVAEMIDWHLSCKQPTCGSSAELEGSWVTTRWESDEKSFESDRRLRKLFRYRSKSTRDLGELSAYWESFTWRAGPVCVIHKGASWGTPQVWAETEDEGKRVIRFAATEAGLDPDTDGEWLVKSSSSPRVGMIGTMRIQQFKGFPWVAQRDGSNWPNLLAKKCNP